MKSIRQLTLVAALLAVTGVAQAQFSSTLTLTSDYDFRGVSQNSKQPAFQASADYALPAGFAIGAWVSPVDFGRDIDEDIELDLYAGWSHSLNDTFGLNAGVVVYAYPEGDDADNYAEIYFGFTAGDFGAKLWYTNDYFALDDKQTALYAEANYTLPVNDIVSFGFHAGYAFGEYWKDGWDDDKSHEQFDASVAVNFAVSHFTITGKITGTDASGAAKVEGDSNNNEWRALVQVATTLPWSND
jgi:uncharacterized protein (TIGR02001 family)